MSNLNQYFQIFWELCVLYWQFENKILWKNPVLKLGKIWQEAKQTLTKPPNIQLYQTLKILSIYDLYILFVLFLNHDNKASNWRHVDTATRH